MGGAICGKAEDLGAEGMTREHCRGQSRGVQDCVHLRSHCTESGTESTCESKHLRIASFCIKSAVRPTGKSNLNRLTGTAQRRVRRAAGRQPSVSRRFVLMFVLDTLLRCGHGGLTPNRSPGGDDERCRSVLVAHLNHLWAVVAGRSSWLSHSGECRRPVASHRAE